MIKIIHAKLIMCLIFSESDFFFLFCGVRGSKEKESRYKTQKETWDSGERECNVFLTLWASNDLCGLLTFLCLMRKSSLLY